MLTKVYIAI